MISLRRVKSTRGMTAKGSPKLSTTWLSTRVRVGSRPRAMTTRDGTMVDQPADPRRDPPPEEALHDDLARHRAHRGRGEARGQERHANTQLAALPSSGSRVLCASSMVPTFVMPVREEGRGRHDEHGHVDEPRHAHGDDHVRDLEAEEPPQLGRLPHHDPALREGGVQEDGVGHHRGPEDAHGKEHALRSRGAAGTTDVEEHLPQGRPVRGSSPRGSSPR